jgi:lipopolysaccharide transport system ATP-binding protein
MPPVITVESLSKKYIIGHQRQQGYTTLRESLMQGANRLLHPFATAKNDPTHEEFWALKEVSFEINQGDRVGIIGRNGAGKSTLLKVLSRITEPTSGRVSIKGRVASLLEVGTGFHPELTGRENIFLNGAILGMSRVEIKSKFDEIVTFAEVERFLDTPVKRYSSGMYVRLAFAVAAHLEPEILIVDEVLAVGDAAFQKKCLGKMEDVGKEGRTVLFVSHNMNVITRLCQRAVLLSAGQVVVRGAAEEVVQHYLNNSLGEQMSSITFADDPEKPYQILAVSLCDSGGGIVQQQMEVEEVFTVKIRYKVSKELPGAFAGFSLRNAAGEVVIISDSRDISGSSVALERPGIKSVAIDFPSPLLVPGRYSLTVAICQPGAGVLDMHQDIVALELVNLRSVRTSWAGYIHIPLPWRVEDISHEMGGENSTSIPEGVDD